MARLIGQIGKTEDQADAIVSVSTRGVEFECEAAFVLTPEDAIAYAEIILQAARARIAEEKAIAHAITDPGRLAELVPVPPEARRPKAGARPR
jgi:hypothetical protein